MKKLKAKTVINRLIKNCSIRLCPSELGLKDIQIDNCFADGYCNDCWKEAKKQIDFGEYNVKE